MKWQGKKLSYVLEGESHSRKMTMKVGGLPKFKFNKKELDEFLARRKAKNATYSTSRIEGDEINFTKGVRNSTTSKKIQFEIKNNNVKSNDYNELEGKPRPSHADYASHAKFNRVDFRGGREFSARLTAPYCVLGGIAKQILSEYGVEVLAYVASVGEINGLSYKTSDITKEQIKEKISNGNFSLSNEEQMLEKIKEAKDDLDSVGGSIECIVFGLKAGVGYTLAEGLESAISNQVFSVPAVKGIEFGAGVDISKMRGSKANDEMFFDKDGKVKTYTNNAGGINGGISNGENITIKVSMRPTPSISKEQKTVDLINKKNTTIQIKGRHDACIVPRAIPVIESAVAIAILDTII